MKIIYPDVQKLIELHNNLIQIWLDEWEWWSFWFLWWKDKTSLQSIIDFVKNDDYYPNLIDKIVYLMYSINKNHIFVDWNKRSSIYFSAYFLLLNIFDDNLVKKYIRELENIAVLVADNKISKDVLFEIISCLISYEEYNEELRLKIYNSMKD